MGRFTKTRICFLVLSLYLVGVPSYGQNIGYWAGADSLIEGRYNNATAVLNNGNVLVAGGEDGKEIATCEIFDVITLKWRTTTALPEALSGLKAVVLQNGKVLVTGGYEKREALIFDPASETWSLTGNTNAAREDGKHTVTVLKDGKVLVVGGVDYSAETGINYISKCEIYDPVTNVWSTTDSLPAGRTQHTAVLLNDGRVLVAGGKPDSISQTSLIYDPATGKWNATAKMNVARTYLTGTLLPDGRVLVTTGRTCEVFDPLKETWSYTNSLQRAISSSNAIMLSTGLIVFAGEDGWELYNPNTFESLGNGALSYYQRKSFIRLQNDRIFAIGGMTMIGMAIKGRRECYQYIPPAVGVDNDNVDDHKLYALSQNYPNPFNPSTVINYSVPKESRVELRVFDLIGQEVRTLVDEVKQKGNYSVEFNASSLPSGIYIYKFSGQGFSAAKKMVVLK